MPRKKPPPGRQQTMITFDEWLDMQLGNIPPEDTHQIQAAVHEACAVFHEWKRGNLTAGEAAAILNIDTSDPESQAVHSYLQTLSTSEMLELEMANRLGQYGIPKYDKAYLRTRWGL